MSDREADPSSVDLTSCDREPIHIPSAILPHGVLLAFDASTLQIIHAAGDTVGFFGTEVAALPGKSISSVLTPDQIARLSLLRDSSSLAKPRHLLDPVMRVKDDRPIDASLHRVADTMILEFEDADPTDPHAVDPLSCVQDMLDGIGGAPSLQDFCQLAAERVRSVAKYDRVMVYRFQTDESGWVFAEARDPDLVPFLDLHYPASDIPRQARALYLESWLRLITAVDYQPAPLMPPLDPSNGKPLDMSHATLRDVSSIHREYLRNMGVGASMSISIIVEGKLWGLIACHHRIAKRLPRHLRAICELFGAMFSLQLEARERAEQFEARLTSRKLLQDIMQELANDDDYGAGLTNQAARLLEYIDAGGMALRVNPRGGMSIRVNNAIHSIGTTPNEDQIAALTDWLTQRMEGGEGVLATDRLGELWEPAKAFADVGAGLMALSISVEPRDFILWFRPEAIQTVTWAGDPTKPVEPGPNGDRLTPRKSFEAWSQSIRGRSTSWQCSDGDAALDLRVSLLDIVLRRIDAAARERERAYAQERLLMSELDHRVKNTLANIQALVSQTSRTAESLIDFTQGLERRIKAMSKAHSLLTESRWVGASISDLVAQELDHYRNGATLTIEGPETVLTAKAALALSLALHELTTNAAKYGALSDVGGAITVVWRTSDVSGINLIWTESGGPIVNPPTRRGFGSTLIERALAIETGGSSTISFDPAGVQCRIELPNDAVVSIGKSAERAPMSATEMQTESVVSQLPKRILVVEDSALVLLTLQHLLEGMGWDAVGPATRVPQALLLAQTEAIDAALLDVNLNGQMSWPVAEVLQERGIPFAFTTGYEGGMIIPTVFSEARVVNKPFQTEDIRQVLTEITCL